MPTLFAAEGIDFSVPSPLEVTFLAGFTTSVPAPAIQILDDDSVEGSHSFGVVLSSVPDQFSGVVNLATDPEIVVINDNDGKVQYAQSASKFC